MKLFEDVLGMHVTYSDWNGAEELPLYMIGSFDYKKAKIDDVSCIIMNLKADFPTLPALKKQIKRVQSIEPMPVVVSVPFMSAYRRKSMIEAHIPFIIAEEQAYLPFMGTVLKARCTNKELEGDALESFRYSTQQLCLWYLYQQNQKAYISDAARTCAFSSMTMTRATRELAATGKIEVTKEGTKKVLSCKCSKKELFENVKRYMKSPVVSEGYLDLQLVNVHMVPAGVTALAERSMINGDRLRTYAMKYRAFDKSKLIDELVNPEKQAKVELWNYDPLLFSKDGFADPISVALSLEKENDERVEMTVEEMLEELWEEIEW